MLATRSTAVCIICLDVDVILSKLLPMRHFLIPFVAVLLVSACASRPDVEHRDDANLRSLPQNMGEAAGETYSQTKSGLGDAALSPLEDFNLRREEIPMLLKNMESPYDLPQDLTCLDLERLIGQLDIVLGPDWDTPNPDERLRTEKLADAASEAALGAVADEARGFIPFRGLIRKATGAESHEKKYNRAFKIGAQRRAYLKGMGLAKGCGLPARPDFTTAELGKLVYKGDAPPIPRPPPRSSVTISSRPIPETSVPETPETSPPQHDDGFYP